MIPLRVSLKNFLCHAEQEFRSEEHPVWLLHGPNGAGKSAVFDAMVYALYGESRRSDDRKNAVGDVIRHGESSMRVEFDFELGEHRYQVWRTRARSGQPRQGVNQWNGGCWSPVRDVNLGRELDDWVVNKLGLTYDTFVSTVLLRQGAAEKLIDADKEARQNLFRGFIDLDPYLRLHDRVAAARAVLSGEVRHLRARLAGMPAVTDDQVAQATAAAQASDEAQQRARSAENADRNRLGHARTWEQNEATRRHVQGELDAASGRARDAAQLEAQVGRLRELRLVVEGLIRVGELKDALAVAEQTCGQKSDEQAAATRRNGELRAELSQARARIAGHREQLAELDRSILAADAEQAQLSAEITRAEKAAGLQEQLAGLRGTQFDPELDARSIEARRAVANAASAKDALPHLQSLSLRRAEHRRAVAEGHTAAAEEEAASAECDRLTADEAAALRESGGANLRQGEAENAAAVAKDQYEKSVKARDRFAAAAAEPVCSECGQLISAAHAAKEQAKFEHAVRTARENLDRCDTTVGVATAIASERRDRHYKLQSERQAAERRRDAAATTRASARTRAVEARAEFDRVLHSIDEPFASRVAAIDEDGFPGEEDLVEARTAEQSLADLVNQRDELLGRLRDREQNRRDIQTLESSLALFDAPADVATVRNELARVENQIGGLRDDRDRNDRGLTAAQESEGKLLDEELELAGRLPQLAADVAMAELAVASTRQLLGEAVAAMPESSRSTARATTPEVREELAAELDRLERAKVEERFEDLAEDRALQSERERQLTEVHQLIAQLPEDARRPVHEIEQEVLHAESATSSAEEQHDTNRTELRTLVEQQEQRRTTDQQLCQAERDHALHDQLAGLLGTEGIQLDLARGAERRIIVRANEILVRLSSGELRFEPPDPLSTRAFDLSVRRMGCPEPIAVGNLSGGQRFRVAVSLALAVCQGAGDDARRLKSVIIDEGFGSLDQDGRAAMVAELRDGPALREMFRCIIVVSHQEDFASAFPVGYRLRSENGMTHVEEFRPG